MNTSSNPIFDLAKEYGLPLEVAYCYAERRKRLLLAKSVEERVAIHEDYWSAWSNEQITKFVCEATGQEYDRRRSIDVKINNLVISFLTVQGRLPI